MMRSIAWLALLECKVPMQRWPVSAKVIAASIVSVSRISPMRITSGAWRSVFFSAFWKVKVSNPTSRCVMMRLLVLMDEFDRVFHGDDVAGWTVLR